MTAAAQRKAVIPAYAGIQCCLAWIPAPDYGPPGQALAGMTLDSGLRRNDGG